MKKNISLALLVSLALLGSSVFGLGFGKAKAPSASKIVGMDIVKAAARAKALKDQSNVEQGKIEEIPIDNEKLSEAWDTILKHVKGAMKQSKETATRDVYDQLKTDPELTEKSISIDALQLELAKAGVHYGLVAELLRLERVAKETLNDMGRKFGNVMELHRQAAEELKQSALQKHAKKEQKKAKKAAAKAKRKAFGAKVKAGAVGAATKVQAGLMKLEERSQAKRDAANAAFEAEEDELDREDAARAAAKATPALPKTPQPIIETTPAPAAAVIPPSPPSIPAG
jgi:hypothetical protein